MDTYQRFLRKFRLRIINLSPARRHNSAANVSPHTHVATPPALVETVRHLSPETTQSGYSATLPVRRI